MGSALNSLIGMVVLIAIAIALSKKRRAINKRTVSIAFAIQFGIGAFVLFVPDGRDALNKISNVVQSVISYGEQGAQFLFGGLLSDKMFEVFGGGGFVFAIRVLPMIVFFSSLISVLYYLGVMRVIVQLLGGALQKALGTSRAESMSAAANIFVGQTEAPLVVKPYISRMTQSELFAVMVGGLASVAGSVLAGYAQMGVPLPYLIAASFMAAPGGLLFAKLILPETEKFEDTSAKLNFTAEGENPPSNVIDAAAAGASTGMQIALNVGAMLIAFVGLIALINGIIGGVAGVFDIQGLTLDKIFGYLFAPLAWLIGAPWSDAQIAGAFIGQKLAINEFVAYSAFGDYLKDPATTIVLTEKSKAIISFALCGFANFSSIAILVGGLSIMAPNRRGDIARLGLLALFAATLSNLMSATIAGLFIGLAG